MEELFGLVLMLSVLVVIISAFVWVFGENKDEVDNAKICFVVSSIISIITLLL